MSRRGFVAAAMSALAVPALARPAIAQGESVLRLRLAHGLAANHPVHVAMEYFASVLRELSDGAMTVQLFPDGQLGQEVQLIELARVGKIDFVKASASVVERFAPAFRVFNLPFVFRDRTHWKAVVTNGVGVSILGTTAAHGLVGLNFYEAGSRSFYGQKPIDHPDDLKGLKIRIQPSPTMLHLMSLFGAEGVQLPWDVVHSALRTGLVDGAENSISALIHGRHGEVVRFYSFDEHTMVPDVFLIGGERWNTLSPAQRDWVQEAARRSHHRMNELWAVFETEARDAIAKMSVTLTYPDKRPFMERAAVMKSDFADDQSLIRLIEQT